VERNLERFCAIARDALGADGVRTIVEIGARDCRETLGFHAAFPAARIHTFECNPATLPQCRAAVAGKPAITLVERAVSNAPGPVTFYAIDQARTETGIENGNPGASSLLQASGKFELETYVQKPVTVEAIRLGDYLEENGVGSVDLLWMDIQGAELMALEGAGKRLDSVKLIHTEVEFVEIYSGQPLFPGIKRFLEARGFAFLGFTIYARHSADAVFANKRLVPPARRLAAVRRNRFLLAKRLTWLRHRAKRLVGGK
jgi:FkbM family methyltransferase